MDEIIRQIAAQGIGLSEKEVYQFLRDSNLLNGVQNETLRTIAADVIKLRIPVSTGDLLEFVFDIGPSVGFTAERKRRSVFGEWMSDPNLSYCAEIESPGSATQFTLSFFYSTGACKTVIPQFGATFRSDEWINVDQIADTNDAVVRDAMAWVFEWNAAIIK